MANPGCSVAGRAMAAVPPVEEGHARRPVFLPFAAALPHTAEQRPSWLGHEYRPGAGDLPDRAARDPDVLHGQAGGVPAAEVEDQRGDLGRLDQALLRRLFGGLGEDLFRSARAEARPMPVSPPVIQAVRPSSGLAVMARLPGRPPPARRSARRRAGRSSCRAR